MSYILEMRLYGELNVSCLVRSRHDLDIRKF
jgi:hypothetical protein